MKRREFVLLSLGSFVFATMLLNLRSPSHIQAQGPPTPVGCVSAQEFSAVCYDGGAPALPCGSYTRTDYFGSGLKGLYSATVPCISGNVPETCPSVTDVTRSADNTACCDQDNDGYRSVQCGGNDCRDDNASINPGAEEICNDGIDNDCDGDTDFESVIDLCNNFLGGVWDSEFCYCWTATPILVDIIGDGFALTSWRGGVNFDLEGNGLRELLSWTGADSDDAFLALDRNGNARIDDGTELFGASTPQPHTTFPNGFLALAEFDKLTNGGNSDGKIDRHDLGFLSLRLWKDLNHDGISQRNELSTLPSLGVAAIGLDYQESRRTDRYGNVFRYRAEVIDEGGAHLGRWAFDVILVRK